MKCESKERNTKIVNGNGVAVVAAEFFRVE